MNALEHYQYADREELADALDKAVSVLVDRLGTCPNDLYELHLESCEKRCVYGIEAQCWRDYLIGRLK